MNQEWNLGAIQLSLKIAIPQEGSNSSVENGGNGNAFADAGKEHGKGTSDA